MLSRGGVRGQDFATGSNVLVTVPIHIAIPPIMVLTFLSKSGPRGVIMYVMHVHIVRSNGDWLMRAGPMHASDVPIAASVMLTIRKDTASWASPMRFVRRPGARRVVDILHVQVPCRAAGLAMCRTIERKAVFKASYGRVLRASGVVKISPGAYSGIRQVQQTCGIKPISPGA